MTTRRGRAAGALLVALGGFLVLGRYLPGLADAIRAKPADVGYLAGPRIFWTIALEDLGDRQPGHDRRGHRDVARPRDPADWKQLRRVLRLSRFLRDAVRDPGYWEALDSARGPVSGGMFLEDAVRVYCPAS